MTNINKAISYTRFSSAGQASGDSERRQVELAEAYASKHDLVIDRDLSFEDLGKSAYDKTNIDKGALGDFLKKVQAGKVPTGTTLLIENFDRLSRAIPLDVLALFTEIINAGLIIVTLHDGQKFSREALEKNPYLLIGVFIEAIRANSESKAKSSRSKGNWSEKQKLAKADGKIMTKKTPYWIRAKADRSSFDLIPERAEVVKWLVAESEKGTGNNTLIKQLHERGIEAWSSSGKWQPSYMQKVLSNPALYGAIMVNDEIVRGYYPPLIDEDRFHRLQALRKSRATTQSTSGRGLTLSNLFSQKLKCGYCGSAMNISGYKEVKSDTRKGYERKYVGCHGARIKDPKACAKTKIWFMDELEPKLLYRLTTLNPSQLVGDTTSKLDDAKLILAGLNGKLAESTRRLGNVIKAIEDGDAPKTLLARSKDLQSMVDALEQQVAAQGAEIRLLEAQGVSGKDRLTALLKLFKLLKTQQGADLKSTRQQLAEEISEVVEKVVLYPAGPTADGDKTMRYMVVTLKNGHSYEIDDSNDNDESLQVDPEDLKQLQ